MRVFSSSHAQCGPTSPTCGRGIRSTSSPSCGFKDRTSIREWEATRDHRTRRTIAISRPPGVRLRRGSTGGRCGETCSSLGFGLVEGGVRACESLQSRFGRLGDGQAGGEGDERFGAVPLFQNSLDGSAGVGFAAQDDEEFVTSGTADHVVWA